ncbi:hypothetical protein EOM82_06850 [bacterium]|nr:hypothetical protein [bacterium]
MKGNNSVEAIFGRWYEGMFLLFAGIAFIGAIVYKSRWSFATAMFFAGIYTFLTLSSRLGGGIQYANNFGFIFVFIGFGALIAFVGIKPHNPYYLIYGMIMLLSGITFIIALTTRIYWIMAVGLVMTAGLTTAAWAIARNQYKFIGDADNEKQSYTKNPERKYVNPYKKVINTISNIITGKDKE